MSKPDIKITEIKKQKFEGLKSSQLVLDITGEQVNAALVNSLRRLAIDYVPTYAFTKESIDIEDNSSIYDNDYMRLRISQMTVPKIKVKTRYLADRFWRNIDYADPNREKDPDDNISIEMYINITNKENNVINVTTNDILYLEDEKTIDKFPKDYPNLIISLRPDERFKCHARAVLGVGKRNNIWAACGNAYYEEIDKNSYRLTLESQGQIDEYETLNKACDILTTKLNDIKFIVGDKYNTSSIINQNSLNITLENEDHTLGNIINEYLQNNKNVAFSGLSKPSLLIDEIVIKFMSINNNPIKPFFETIDLIIKLFTDIKNQIKKLSS